mgnify:CR=1 FL=1
MTQLIIGSMLVGIIPLALIVIFSKIDNELSEAIKLKRKDIAIIVVVAIIYGILYSSLYHLDIKFINTTFLTAYLVFMSYTDQKTKLLYSSVSIAMMLLEIITFIQQLRYLRMKDLITLI